MVVPDVLEPMDLARIFKKAQCNGVHWRIAPPFVEEATCSVQMCEEIFIRLAAPEVKTRDLEVRPEVASRIPMRLLVVFGPALGVHKPAHRIVVVEVLGVRGKEFECLEPEGGDALWAVVEVDVEAVGLVVVGHVAEDVIVHVAEELDLRLDAPVVLRVFERRVVVEEAAVPAAHLVVGDTVRVLDVVLFQDPGRLFEEVGTDPRRSRPVVFRDCVVGALCFCGGLGLALELIREWDIVEEGPGVVELAIPGAFKVSHCGEELVELFVADEGEERGVDAGGIWGVWGVGCVGAPEGLGWLADWIEERVALHVLDDFAILTTRFRNDGRRFEEEVDEEEDKSDSQGGQETHWPGDGHGNAQVRVMADIGRVGASRTVP